MTPARDVVIIGAPRSGTNVLRDVLTSLPGVTTWPCDEINPIWHHGNRSERCDELRPEQARPEVAAYIRRRFDRVRRRDAAVVVEKTCANSLRVPFVRAVLPHAHYVLITRDGIDAAASAVLRWDAPLDLRYTLAKARFVPLSDVVPLTADFVAGRLRRWGGTRADDRPADRVTRWWGPRPADFRALAAEHPVEELCAIQWQRCVDAALRDVQDLPDDRLLHVVYEDFVRDPAAHLARLADFLDMPSSADHTHVHQVSAASIGKGRAALGEKAVTRLEALVGPTLDRLGYGH